METDREYPTSATLPSAVKRFQLDTENIQGVPLRLFASFINLKILKAEAVVPPVFHNGLAALAAPDSRRAGASAQNRFGFHDHQRPTNCLFVRFVEPEAS